MPTQSSTSGRGRGRGRGRGGTSRGGASSGRGSKPLGGGSPPLQTLDALTSLAAWASGGATAGTPLTAWAAGDAIAWTPLTDWASGGCAARQRPEANKHECSPREGAPGSALRVDGATHLHKRGQTAAGGKSVLAGSGITARQPQIGSPQKDSLRPTTPAGAKGAPSQVGGWSPDSRIELSLKSSILKIGLRVLSWAGSCCRLVAL